MSLSRREWLRTVGAVGVGAVAPLEPLIPPVRSSSVHVATRHAPGDIVELYSTSDVFTPARGRTWMKFSFDFPEPAVVFGDYRFSFLVFTDENTYGLDRSRMRATGTAEALELRCDGLVWAGGQEHAPGTVTVAFTQRDSTVEWHVTVEMDRPIKSVTTVIRDIPRGRLSLGGGQLIDTKDGDLLAGYPFGAGDLHNFDVTSMTTPLAVVRAGDHDFRYLTTLDGLVRPKRYYFQAGERAFRVEAVYEHDAWRNDRRIEVPGWRLGRARSLEEAVAPHMQHVEQIFSLASWETRADVPVWMREIALVTTLHGMHYTASCSMTTRVSSRFSAGSRRRSRRRGCWYSSRRGTVDTTGTIRITPFRREWEGKPGFGGSSRKGSGSASR